MKIFKIKKDYNRLGQKKAIIYLHMFEFLLTTLLSSILPLNTLFNAFQTKAYCTICWAMAATLADTLAKVFSNFFYFVGECIDNKCQLMENVALACLKMLGYF